METRGVTQPSTRRRPQGPTGSTWRFAGFTLIELMIAVAIVAILASIAYPSYTRYVQEARRTDAMSALSSVAGQLERCYTVGGDYGAASCPSGTQASGEGFYIVSIAVTASGAEYTLTATPQGAQAGDDCGSFTLDHQGVRTPDGCW